MKQKLFYLMMCLSIAFGGMSFMSCSSDDDDDDNNNNDAGTSTQSPLVGTWKSDSGNDAHYETYTFTNDGKVTNVGYDDNSYTDNGKLIYQHISTATYTGTYAFAENELVINIKQKDRQEKTTTYYDWGYMDGNYYYYKLDNPEVTEKSDSESCNYTWSRSIIKVEGSVMMWKYEWETDSGDVRTTTESFTKM